MEQAKKVRESFIWIQCFGSVHTNQDIIVYPNIVWNWEGEGRAIRGIQIVTEVHMTLNQHI